MGQIQKAAVQVSANLERYDYPFIVTRENFGELVSKISEWGCITPQERRSYGCATVIFIGEQTTWRLTRAHGAEGLRAAI